MTFETPEALESYLSQLTICCSFTVDTDATTHSAFDGDARLPDESWIHLVSDYSEESEDRPRRWHFHIDLKRSFTAKKKPASHELQDIIQQAEHAIGQIDRTAAVHSVFKVPREILPPDGVIQPFVGLAVSQHDTKLQVRGLKYNVEDSEIEGLSWQIAKSQKDVEVTLVSRRPLTIQSDVLVSLQQKHASVFNRLILEKS